MGGEYLPALSQNEVMIASITIASTTQDVTSVYARRGRKRIYYRVVDEYGGETLSGRSTRSSTQPLTRGQLEQFFNGAWSIFHVLAMNFDDYDLARMLGSSGASNRRSIQKSRRSTERALKPGPPRGEPSSTRTRWKLKTGNQQTRPAPAPAMSTVHKLTAQHFPINVSSRE